MIDAMTCEVVVCVSIRSCSSRGGFELTTFPSTPTAHLRRGDDRGEREVTVGLSEGERAEVARLAHAVSADEQARVVEDHLFAMFDETVEVRRSTETIRVHNPRGALPDGPARDLFVWGRNLLDRHLP